MSILRRLTDATIVAGSMLIVTSATADSYRIEELFSNEDRMLQFIQLVGVSRDMLPGATLVTTEGSSAKTFTFPAASELPQPPFTPYLLIVSQSFTRLGREWPNIVAEWDYVMPDGFLPTKGGTITLNTIDGTESWAYDRLPTDGYSALYRSGGVGRHRAHSSAHGVVIVLGLDDLQGLTEYANASGDRHFITAFRAERQLLDTGVISGWHQLYPEFVEEFGDYTGLIGFGRRVEVFSHPVCRFYLPPPSDSHFFTASEEECADVQARFPQLILETDRAFYAGLPDPVTGACAVGTSPMYRLWNSTTNDHWFTADDNTRAKAMSQGYRPEGYGPKGVAMCVLLSCYTC